jgi:hypothetical protein
LFNNLSLFIQGVKQINGPSGTLPVLLFLRHRHRQFFNLLIYLKSFLSAEPRRDTRAEEFFNAKDECEVQAAQMPLLGVFYLVELEAQMFGN